MSSDFKTGIAILISWPREIDMFAQLIEYLGFNVVFLVNDLEYSERERVDNVNNIVSALKKNNWDYSFLSQSLGKIRFPVLVSTGLSFQEKRTFKSLLKYFYALIIGEFFEITGISNILEKRTGKRFSAGGIRAVKFERIQPERKLADFTVRFPKGLDVSKKYYPEQRWLNVFDLHLCHGDIDKKLIQDKFPGENCIKIGYPKYALEQDKAEAGKRIRDELLIPEDKKPLILWMPTHLKDQVENGSNIHSWISRLQRIQDKFHIITRIHPKTVITNPEIPTQLKKSGFFIDMKQTRNLNALYSSADLVLADFGASVLSSIYMKKNLLLLGFDSMAQSIVKSQSAEYLDLEVRNYLPVIEDETQITKYFEQSIQKNLPNTLKIRELLFGLEAETHSISEVAEILLKKMKAASKEMKI